MAVPVNRQAAIKSQCHMSVRTQTTWATYNVYRVLNKPEGEPAFCAQSTSNPGYSCAPQHQAWPWVAR